MSPPSMEPEKPTILNLPPEVLRLIFAQPILYQRPSPSASSQLTRFPVPSRTTAPLLLTWVCSSWRHLALNTPTLWTSLSLGTLRSTPTADLPILSLFLSRSGDSDSLPLSLELHYDLPGSSDPLGLQSALAEESENGNWSGVSIQRPPHPNQNQNQNSTRTRTQKQSESYIRGMTALARKLIPFRTRWRDLSVNVLVLGALDPFLRTLPFGAPLLETLTLSTKYSGIFGGRTELDLTLCPRLREVRILSPMVLISQSPALPMPILEKLTSLELLFCQSQLEVLAWLSCAPNLERLTIELYAAQPLGPSHVQELTLPNLTSVSITCFYGDCDPGTILDSLTLPSLSAFRLAMSDINRHGTSIPGSGGPWMKVVRLLERGDSAKLTLLSLPDTPMGPAELRRTLMLARNCKHVVLGGEAVTDELLGEIEGSSISRDADKATLLLPKLLSLELHDVKATPSSIINLARKRAMRRENRYEDPRRTLKSLVIGRDVLDDASLSLLLLPKELVVQFV